MADEALSRQMDELEALAAMYSGDGESFAIEESHAGETACTLSLRLLGVVASLHITLPRLYPTSVPPRLAVSIPALRDHSSLTAALDQIAAEGVAADREVLFEVCQAFQERATEFASDHAAATHVAVPEAAGETGGQTRCVCFVWFHHIKNLNKRKHIVSWARDAALRGFSKPGFPGVVAVEGEAGACAEYLARLRALRWQVMEVRLRAELADDAPTLCAPFTELPEAGMGDAAALCESAHLLAEFRAAVLKLPSKPVEESGVS